MISKKRFIQLKEGDILIFVTPKGKTISRYIEKKIRNNSVTLRRINVYRPYGHPTTVYTYSDIYKKVIGVLKIKNGTEKNL